MPIEHYESDDRHGVFYRMHGVLTATDLFALHGPDALQTQQLAHARYLLVDYTDLVRIEVEPRQVRELLGTVVGIATINADLLLSVAAPQLLPYGLSRAFKVLAHFHLRVEVARDRATAIAHVREHLRAAGVDHDVDAFVRSCLSASQRDATGS